VVRNLWIFFLIAVPLIPKFRIIENLPLLLDDLALAFAVGLAMVELLARSAVLGTSRFILSYTGFILTKIGVPFWVLAAVVHRMYQLEVQRVASA
jgi:hypothetical protein